MRGGVLGRAAVAAGLGLCVGALAAAYEPVPAAADSVHVIEQFSGDTWNDQDSAVDLIRAAGASSLRLRLGPGTETVELGASGRDIGAEGLVLNGTTSPGIVVIDGGGRTVALGEMRGSLLTVGSGVQLTLRNITLKGKTENNTRLVKVEGIGAELILEGGAAIADNRGDGYGGGVSAGKGGTFTMNGGEICGCRSGMGGGGVNIEGGRVIMNSGKISGNIGMYNGGGVCVTDGGVFTMNGGSIEDNSTAISGGGVVVRSGVFTMNGGSITGNSATNGGGVAIEQGAAFTMMSGSIGGNRANNHGGGVWVYSGTFTMNGGIIYGIGSRLRNNASFGAVLYKVSDGSGYTINNTMGKE
jgi:hypothetical protein